jgi:hypothetical protein
MVVLLVRRDDAILNPYLKLKRDFGFGPFAAFWKWSI